MSNASYTDEKSCGAIIYRINNGKIEYLLLLQNHSNTWSFPKGHVMNGETELQTAQREVKEETGLELKAISGFRQEMIYNISGGRTKLVVLFLAELNGEIKIQKSEINRAVWVDRNEVVSLMKGADVPKMIEIAETRYIKNNQSIKNRP